MTLLHASPNGSLDVFKVILENEHSKIETEKDTMV